MSNIKIGIGIPNGGSIKTQTVLSLLKVLKNIKYKYEVYFKEGSILHWNRESIVMGAIKDKCTHLLFIDTDMSFDGIVLDRLLSHKKDIVGVHYNQKKFPLRTTLIPKKEINDSEVLIECDSVGTGLVLIDLKVFEKMSHPWFFWEANEDGSVKTGEDYWFCRKARELGYSVWADLSLQVKHWHEFAY